MGEASGITAIARPVTRSAEHIPDRLEAWGLFRGLSADVVAVSISDTPTFELIVGLYTLGDDRLAEKRRNLHERYGRSAETMAARLSAIGIPATGHVRNGDVAQEILHAARDHGADLVITGSRGLGALDRLLLGSVARNVLTHFGGSVLIMREAPPAFKERVEAWGPIGSRLEVTRRVKEKFDPRGGMNPGRFLGGN